jgi:capsular polysaccharide biosynthesis protein
MPRTDLTHVLMRRWYVVLVGLVVTAALAVGAMHVVPATYSAKADVLLLPPKAPDSENPYLGLGDLAPVASALARNVLSDATSVRLAADGITKNYSVVVDSTVSAPIMLVTASGNTSADALTAVERVTAIVAPTLLQLQQAQDVPTKDLITSTVIHTDKSATAIRKSQTRAVLIAIVLGLVLTGLAAALIDRMALRRRRRGPGDAGRSAPTEKNSAATPTIATPSAPVYVPPVPGAAAGRPDFDLASGPSVAGRRVRRRVQRRTSTGAQMPYIAGSAHRPVEDDVSNEPDNARTPAVVANGADPRSLPAEFGSTDAGHE